MDEARLPICLSSAVIRSFFGEQIDAIVHLAELYPATSKRSFPYWQTLCGCEFETRNFYEFIVSVEESDQVSDCLSCRRTQRDLGIL